MDFTTSPWEILQYNAGVINFIGGTEGLYYSLEVIVIGFAVIMLMCTILYALYANMIGSSKDIQESKSKILSRLVTITFIASLAALLSFGKNIVDSMFGVKTNDVTEATLVVNPDVYNTIAYQNRGFYRTHEVCDGTGRYYNPDNPSEMITEEEFDKYVEEHFGKDEEKVPYYKWSNEIEEDDNEYDPLNDYRYMESYQ